MNIIDHLTTPGNFVFTPKGEYACVRAFDATTNEVEVSLGAVGLLEALARRTGRQEAFEADMRRAGTWRSYHFKNLRVAPSTDQTEEKS